MVASGRLAPNYHTKHIQPIWILHYFLQLRSSVMLFLVNVIPLTPCMKVVLKRDRGYRKGTLYLNPRFASMRIVESKEPPTIDNASSTMWATMNPSGILGPKLLCMGLNYFLRYLGAFIYPVRRSYYTQAHAWRRWRSSSKVLASAAPPPKVENTATRSSPIRPCNSTTLPHGTTDGALHTHLLFVCGALTLQFMHSQKRRGILSHFFKYLPLRHRQLYSTTFTWCWRRVSRLLKIILGLDYFFSSTMSLLDVL